MSSSSLAAVRHGGPGSVPLDAPSEIFLFGPVIIRIRREDEVWKPTPHGQTLGDGMARVQHALVGKIALEIGVGSGVHAIAALKLGVQSIDVTEIDPAALETAEKNAALNGVAYRDVRVANWLDFEIEKPYDLVLCNPPFCKSGKPDRRFFIQELIRQSPRFLHSGGHLLFVQSSMADFAKTESQLREAGFFYTAVHESRGLFRDYYFDEPGFIEESRRIRTGFEEIDGALIETLRVYLCTKP
jgi:methylase of polypeptide subunit release factors